MNAALRELGAALAAKYALLGMPPSQRSALTEAERKRHAAHRQLEADAPKGAFFLSEEDLKGMAAIRADASS